MPRAKLKSFVKERFGMDLCEFIKQKVEADTLHDHEIASILGENKSSICKLRRAFGIKKANGFSRRFERTYGEGAIERFKEIIRDPNSSLTDAGRHFGFTREYARQVYKKIYGCPYTQAYQKKRLIKKKRLTEMSRKSKQMENLLKITKKMKSMGLSSKITNRGRSYMILTNGYKLGIRSTSTPVLIGKKRYFRITDAKNANADFDFFICLCRNKKEDIHFIIPSGAMPRSVLSLLARAKPDQTKYTQFREAWHLLVNKNPRDSDPLSEEKMLYEMS